MAHSSDLDDAARIETVVGVEGEFQGTHGGQLLRCLGALELLRLETSDAVLCGDGAAFGKDSVVHEPVNGFFMREGDAGGTDVEVQVPVALVAEDGGLYAREGLLKGGACFPDEADEA